MTQMSTILFLAALLAPAFTPPTSAPTAFPVDDAPPDTWPPREAAFLTNVRQLTTPAMGLDKAGEAYFAPDQRTIIFQAFPKGESAYQMFTLALDARGNPLSNSLNRVSPPAPGGEPTACTCGFFSPDGRKIIFGSTYKNPKAPSEPVYHRQRSGYTWDMPLGMDIYEADVDGSHIKPLSTATGYDAEGSYSPDGRQIVFTSCRDNGDPELYVMNADGSNPRRLTNHPGYDGGPFFSPDGKRIIFRADRNQNDLLQLFVINADGNGERQLTNNKEVNWGPYWHPNGRTVAFATSVHGHRNYEVYLMNIDTGRTARLTFHDGFDGLPVFSPDGKRLMWTSKRGPDNTSQIFLADVKLPEGF